MRSRTSHARRDSPPSPPPCRTFESDWQEGIPFCWKLGSSAQDRPSPPSFSYQVHERQGEDEVVFSDRPTFIHFTPAKRSPFGRYLGLPVEESRPPLFQPVHARFGLTEEAFEAELKLEIDEVLLTAADERERDKEHACCSSSQSASTPLRILSKDDYLKLLHDRGLPLTGPLLGVYLWAADLGRTQFNFDFDHDDLSILDAFD